MYSLDVIHSINERASRKALAPKKSSRDCSFNASRGGIVIHSARHRDTVFISGGVGATLRKLRNLSGQRLNSYIEELYSQSV